MSILNRSKEGDIRSPSLSFFERMKQLKVLFCEDPYRLFFPLGVIIGIFGIGHWLFFALGWTKAYSGFYHSSIQMQAYMASFVMGFLLTSLPRFASAPQATGKELAIFLLWIFGVWIFSFQHHWILSEFCFIGLLLTLASFAFHRFRKRSAISLPPVEFIWIPSALLNGLLGSLLLILGQAGGGPPFILAMGKSMVDQGFLLSIVVGVGGFLSPRLMGRFQGMGNLDPNLIAKFRRLRLTQYFYLAVLLFVSFILEGMGWKISAYVVRALVVTSMLFLTRSLPRPPRAPDMYVWMIWISLWMVFLGSWSTVFFPRYRVEMLHIVFIGGFGLMTFAVGTMVVMSHSGQAMRLRRPMGILWIVSLGLALALIFRMTAGLYPRHYFIFLGAGAACWLLAGLSWLIFSFSQVFKIPTSEAFEQFHEESKKRVEEMKKTC